MKIVNPKRSTLQSDVIQAFSDESRFVASGIAKGYTSECYSWIAEFLSKSTNNNFINPHSAYVSFYSDKEIVYQELGNVSRAYQEYSFFSSVARQILPPHNFELSKKQYATIGNKGVESDLIEYLNISDQMKISQEQSDDQPEEFQTKSYHHGYWRAPSFYSTGYRIHLDDANTSAEFYDKYYWGVPNLTHSIIGLEGAEFHFGEFWNDLMDPSYQTFHEIRDLIGNEGDDYLENEYPAVRRMVDIKFNIANNKFFYFQNSYEWICYYNDTTHYSNHEYSPYYGLVNFYFSDDGQSIIHFLAVDWQQIYQTLPGQSLTFYPKITRGQSVEPAKIISYWNASVSGQMAINMGVTNSESDDQSRIVYNACKHMIDNYSIRKLVGDEYLYGGIDVDTERNRRYSAVVTTEPYMVTVPIGDGELVKYAFIDIFGNLISASNPFHYHTKNAIFLKIKASKSMITELDRLINTYDVNTDIIDTLIIEDVINDSRYQQLLTDSKYYNNFTDVSVSTEIFIKRQDDCVDDLVGIDGHDTYGIAGDGTHKEFVIPTFSLVTESKYKDSLMKVNGIGFVSRMVYVEDYSYWSPVRDLYIYCSNYTAKNAPEPGDSGTDGIPNERKTFIATPEGLITSVRSGERFMPMIKLPGINGYIKIIEKNKAFKITRDKDGLYELVYNVEFPYCPGSYSERAAMNFSGDDPYKETWILKKLSYINAGSRSSITDGYHPTQRCDVSNDRYAPFADDSFCSHSVLYQKESSGNTYTNQFKNGGGSADIEQSYQKNLVKYPADLVWIDGGFRLLSLIKPRIRWARTYGTYDILVNYDDRDLKLFGLFDNRKWRFAKNRFISYIDRENPAHVYEIDISALFEEFSIYQKDEAVIPDVKRWLYGYFSGFANMMTGPDLHADDTETGDESVIVTEKINNIANNDLTSNDSESNIVLEVWDSLSNIGSSDVYGNWRPIVPVSTDTKKIPGKLIIDNIHISHYQDSTSDGIHKIFPIPPDDIGTGTGVYYATIGYADIVNGTLLFPSDMHYGVIGQDSLSGRSNLVLYDKVNLWTYHIIYVKSIGDPDSIGRQLYKVYFYRNSTDPVLPILDPLSFEIDEINLLAIYEPKKQISKNISFDLTTSEAMQGVVDNIITRFFDIKSGTDDRYIVDNKIYLRTRVVRKKNDDINSDIGQFDQSYDSTDSSTIQYNGSIMDRNILTDYKEWSNFPWFNIETGLMDTEFDWKKVVSKEIVRKLGATYFKLASK